MGEVPEMSSAKEVLGSSHSLCTDLLRKGSMGSSDSKPVSFICAQGDQVLFT